MRNIKSILIIFAIAGMNVLKAGNGWINNTVNLSDALKDPASAVSVELDCSSNSDPGKFIPLVLSFTSLKDIVLTGNGRSMGWDRLLLALSTSSSLQNVEFRDNHFKQVLGKTDGLRNVKGLMISGNAGMDLDGMMDKIADMDHLEELRLELFSLSELPVNIADADQLKDLYLYNKEVVFGNDPVKGEEQLKTESDFNIDWTNDMNEPRKLAVHYFSIGQSISGKDMYAMSNLFPRADLSSFTAMDNSPHKIDPWKNEFKTWNKTYVNVKPPIPDVDVEKNYYSVNANVGGDFTYASGTRIHIPPFAFSDANGKTVTGDIVIDYREFRDQADILASGIPMTYDSGGVMNNFESAGMFEINASQNGKEIFLKKDRKIEMEFASTDDRSSFNLYAFNDSANNWDILGKPNLVNPNVADGANGKNYQLSKACLVYKSMLALSKRKVYDSLPFNERFSNDKYAYTERKGNKEKLGHRIYVAKDHYSRWLVKPSHITTINGNAKFDVKFFASKNPELNCFTGISWLTVDKMSSKELRNLLSNKYRFTDLRIARDGDHYKMEWKGYGVMQSVDVIPVTYNSKTKKLLTPKDGGNTRFRHYCRALRSREREFNKKLASGKLENNIYNMIDPSEQKEYAWKQTRSAMDTKELGMSRSEWEKYFEAESKKETPLVYRQTENEVNLDRSITLSGMGIYNCDQVSRIPAPITVNATFLKGDSILNTTTTYVVEKDKKCVFRYGGQWSFEGASTQVSFSRSSPSVMITVQADGRLFVYTAEQFKDDKFPKDELTHDFKMKPVEFTISSVKDLRKLLNAN